MSKTQKKAALPDVRRTAAVASKPTIASLLGTPILLDGESLERREGMAQPLRHESSRGIRSKKSTSMTSLRRNGRNCVAGARKSIFCAPPPTRAYGSLLHR